MKNKNRNYYLSASLICADFLHLQKDVTLLEKGKIDFMHFDVMDGMFVPRFGLFPEILREVRKISKVPMDIHMMVEDPEEYIDTFISCGANKDDIFTIHVESIRHLHRVVKKIKSSGLRVGVALNPATPLVTLNYILDDIDMVMLMAINPGIVGHKLIPSTLQKISDVKAIIGEKNIYIGVDGGVTPESAPKMLKNGANYVVCGTQSIFKPNTSITKNITDLRNLLDKTL